MAYTTSLATRCVYGGGSAEKEKEAKGDAIFSETSGPSAACR